MAPGQRHSEHNKKLGARDLLLFLLIFPFRFFILTLR